jgi:hypothetical protein
MTIATAQRLLNQRLHFGDAHQVEALRFLRLVAQARERVMKCKRCVGEGLTRRGKLCPFCAEDYEADVLRALGVAEEP